MASRRTGEGALEVSMVASSVSLTGRLRALPVAPVLGKDNPPPDVHLHHPLLLGIAPEAQREWTGPWRCVDGCQP